MIKLFKYAMDAIFSFSYKPLRLGLALGGLVMAVAVSLSLALAGGVLFGHARAAGMGTALIVLFMGGIQLLCIGLLGEYLGRIYDEVRRRPLYLVHKLHRAENVDRPYPVDIISTAA